MKKNRKSEIVSAVVLLLLGGICWLIGDKLSDLALWKAFTMAFVVLGAS